MEQGCIHATFDTIFFHSQGRLDVDSAAPEMVVRVSYTVPIRLSYDPETEWTPPTPRKRPRRVSEGGREGGGALGVRVRVDHLCKS